MIVNYFVSAMRRPFVREVAAAAAELQEHPSNLERSPCNVKLADATQILINRCRTFRKRQVSRWSLRFENRRRIPRILGELRRQFREMASTRGARYENARPSIRRRGRFISLHYLACTFDTLTRRSFATLLRVSSVHE